MELKNRTAMLPVTTGFSQADNTVDGLLTFMRESQRRGGSSRSEIEQG